MRSIRRLTVRIVLLLFVLAGLVVVYPGNSGALASTRQTYTPAKSSVSVDRAISTKGFQQDSQPVAHIAAYTDSGQCNPPCGSGYLRYYGGKVQLQPAAYLIFWGSFWKNNSGQLNADGQVVKKYFSDVSGTNFENILTQYAMQNPDGSQTYISNTEQFNSTHIWIDTSKISPTDSTCSSGSTIEDSTIRAEVNKAITKYKWPKNVNTTYFVYTPPSYTINGNDLHMGCSNKNQPHAYCGYHSSVSSSFAYAELIYPVPGCTVDKTKSPNKDVNGDSLTDVTSHEQFEAITNPLGSSWLDSIGYEIGDKCNFTFPTSYTHLNNGGIFEIQEEFSDATGTCVNTFIPHLTVNTTADYSPPCAILAYSLRCAISQVNTDGIVRPIWFNIASSDSGCLLNTIQGQNVYVCTITPTSNLPTLTASNISINGYTQPGARGNTLTMGSGDNAILTIRIDGSNNVGGLVLTGNATLDHLLGLEITNFTYGISLAASAVQSDTISGDFIGTDGTYALGNGIGIYIASGASFNNVGLGTSISVNLISGNSYDGVYISASDGNVISGNYIGTDSSGQAALHKNKGRHIPRPSRNYGIANFIGIALTAGASNNLIGGILSSSANFISYNSTGIASEGGSNTGMVGNTISSNYIGVQAETGETGDTIDQNIITSNTDAGVLVGNSSTDSTHVAIQSNSIYGNGGLGIDLYPADQVNCSGPTPGAPNDYTPCPIIQTATPTQISGTACVGCLVEVYIATNEGDDQGHGEGQTFIGSATADGSGNWSLGVSLSSGTEVTATATTASSPMETSEFAANVVASNNTGGNLWVTGHDADYHCANEGNQCNYLNIAVNYVMKGSTLPVLALDHGTQVSIAISNAFGGSGPTVVTVDPRTQFAGLPLVDSNGKPLYSAIVVASDTTCGGCDNNDGFGVTPDSDAINARTSDIQAFFNAGGGILALAGADNISVFYNFLPVQAIGAATTSPYTFTSLGLSLGLIEGQDDNCCATHNSFQLPGNSFQVAEVDSAGLAETMIVQNGSSMQWKRPARATQKPHVPQNPIR